MANTNPRFIAFHYTLKTKAGELLEDSHGGDPFGFVEGTNTIIPGLEKAVLALKAGDKKAVHVTPEDGYGKYDPNLSKKMGRDQFPKDETVEVGDQFRLNLPGEEPRIYTITELGNDWVKMDGNHPLAGRDLVFDVEVMEVREATEDDMMDDDSCCDGDHEHHTHH